jgi:hypothetical protein
MFSTTNLRSVFNRLALTTRIVAPLAAGIVLLVDVDSAFARGGSGTPTKQF